MPLAWSHAQWFYALNYTSTLASDRADERHPSYLSDDKNYSARSAVLASGRGRLDNTLKGDNYASVMSRPAHMRGKISISSGLSSEGELSRCVQSAGQQHGGGDVDWMDQDAELGGSRLQGIGGRHQAGAQPGLQPPHRDGLPQGRLCGGEPQCALGHLLLQPAFHISSPSG